MMDPKDYFKAHLKAHELAMNLYSAHERFNWNTENMHEYSVARANETMQELADLFGFDLVPREKHKLEAAE